MAKKNVVPKKVAGVKVPRTIRKSKMLRSLLASSVGRDILANALTAGAGAAATVLVAERAEIADAGKKGVRKGSKAVGIATAAVQSAANAVMEVVSDAARSVLPEAPPPKSKKGQSRSQTVRH